MTVKKTLDNALDELENVGEALVTVEFERNAFFVFQWRDTPLKRNVLQCFINLPKNLESR
jgi:hypothetical protein